MGGDSLWEKVDDETLEALKQQKAFEDETAKKLSPLYNSATNPFVRIFIHRIILDTMKHSDTYQTLIELNRRVVLGEIDRKKMTEELTTHIKNEGKMLDRAKEISRTVKDENFRKILEHIIEDEIQHHRILQDIFEIIKKEGEDWNRYLYDMFTGAGIP